MPARAVRNQHHYNKLLEGFRLKPGNFMGAAAFAGVDPRTARTVWYKGWPHLGEWASPICERIKEEREKSLAAISERAVRDKAEAEEERERAKGESVRIREEEERIKAMCRGVIVQQLAMVRELVTAGRALGRKVLLETCNKKLDPATGEVSWEPKDPGSIKGGVRDCLMNLDRLTKVNQRTLEVAGAILEQGRLDRGEPGAIVGFSLLDDLTPDRAAEIIEQQDLVMDIIRREAEEAKHQKYLPGLTAIRYEDAAQDAEVLPEHP